VVGRIRALLRSVAVSKTSRSRFAKPACWNTPEAAEFFNVLRLVPGTQPRSNLVAFGESARPAPGMMRRKFADCQLPASPHNRNRL